jgi:two-component system, cell cycle sensor histidine kinase and response regulator CckA
VGSRHLTTGISTLGLVPSGTRICLFYAGTAEILEIVLPFLREGIEAGERCWWQLPGTLSSAEACAALQTVCADLAVRMGSGQVTLSDREAPAESTGAARPTRTVTAGCAHNTTPATGLGLCALALDGLDAAAALRAATSHDFVLTKDAGAWHALANRRADAEDGQFWRRVFEAAGAGLSVLGPDRSTYEAVNAAYAGLHGYKPEELAGLSPAALSTPDDWERLRAGAAARGVPGPFSFEVTRVRKDGSQFPAAISVSMLLGESGNAQHHVGCILDLSERVRYERALSRAVQRLNAHLDNSAVAVIEFDRDFHFTRWSRGAEMMFGWQEHEVLGKHANDVGWVYPADRAAVKQAVDVMMESPNHCSQSANRNCRKDGTVLHCKWHSSALCDAGGRVESVLILGVDITAQIAAQEELARSQALYGAMTRNIPDGLTLAVDADMRFTAVDGPLLAKLGIPGALLKGLPLERAFANRPQLRPPIEDAFRRALQGESVNIETEYGGRVLWARYVPLLDEAGRPIGAMNLTLDVTERRRVEEQLRQAQKLESVALLAGGIAHDFNNLLVGIVGNASLAEDLLPPGSPALSVIRQVAKAGEQAAHLTRQMLAYAGKGQFVVEAVSLTDLVLETSPLVESTISRKTPIHLHLENPAPLIEADPSQMQQILMNLTLNAAEAMGSKAGVISISTGEMALDEALIEQRLALWPARPGRYAYLEVSDNGCGMGAATTARIFDPFFTTKFHGRGLGLAAVAGIVRALKGGIELETAPNRGSRFRVLLPASESGATNRVPSKPVGGELRGHETLLVVDDEAVVREFAKLCLERYGYRVLAAASGEEAVRALQAVPAVDLVILDLSMPGMSGEETLPRLREVAAGVRVTVSSGYSEDEALRFFGGQHVAGFIQKPYTLRDLARHVRRALESD